MCALCEKVITQDMVSAEFEWKVQDYVAELTSLTKKAGFQCLQSAHRLSDVTCVSRDCWSFDKVQTTKFFGLVSPLLLHKRVFLLLFLSLCIFFSDPEYCCRAAYNSDEGNLILNLIEQSGNMGIWSRTLKAKSGLHQTVIDKCLKLLEGQKSIKSVKSIKHPTRKIYLLYNTTPSTELTGGPWYSGSDLDIDFVSSLLKLCQKLIHQAVSS